MENIFDLTSVPKAPQRRLDFAPIEPSEMLVTRADSERFIFAYHARRPTNVVATKFVHSSGKARRRVYMTDFWASWVLTDHMHSAMMPAVLPI